MSRRNLNIRMRDAGCGMRGKLPFALYPASCILLMIFLCVAIDATAAPQDAVPLNGEAFFGELVSVAADGGVTFRVVAKTDAPAGAGSPIQTLPLNELVRWGHPVAARPQTIVVLAGGGRLVTAPDWAGGAAVRLDGDAINALSDSFGEVRLPRGDVRGIVFVHQRHAAERAALADRVRSEPSPNPSQQGRGNEDALFLTNGDRLAGAIQDLARGSVKIETDAGIAKMPLSRVEAIMFGKSHQPSAVGHQPELIVGLRDGSILYANAVRGDESEFVVELGHGVKLPGDGAHDVVLLQSLGGRFVYLSDLEPAGYRHVPYLNIEWPYQRDRNVLGEPLVVRGKHYLKGIGMHSAGRLTYRLDDAYQRFDAAMAVDDSAGGRGSVTFGVYVLRDGQWQEAFTSGVVRGGDESVPVSVDVSGAQGLTLTVDFADRGDEMDRAVWLDARLVKSKI